MLLYCVSALLTSYPFVEVCAILVAVVVCTHVALRFIESSLQISENLIPQAARLILANSTTTNNASEQQDSAADFGDPDSGDDYDYVVTDDTTSDSDELIEEHNNHRDSNSHRQRQPNIPPPDYDDNNFVDDFRDSYVDYGNYTKNIKNTHKSYYGAKGMGFSKSQWILVDDIGAIELKCK